MIYVNVDVLSQSIAPQHICVAVSTSVPLRTSGIIQRRYDKGTHVFAGLRFTWLLHDLKARVSDRREVGK